MSTPHSSSLVSSSRLGARTPCIATFMLLLSAGVMPVGAQQRVEVTTTRRTQRAEPADSSERQVRKLQRQLDSLTRTYTESEALSASERRQIELAVSQTIRQLVDVSTRLDDVGDRTLRPVDGMRLRISPMGPGAPSEMSRAMTQAREMRLAMPTGWIGLVTEGPGLEQRYTGGEWIIRYLSYPRIVSIDPSSPAQRAGLTPGDTLLAYDGRDVRENDISLTRLLRPNARVSVRVGRDGRTREVPVIVGEAPTGVLLRRGDEGRTARDPWLIVGVPEAPSFPRSTTPALPSTGAPRVIIRPPIAPSAPTPAIAPTPAFGLTFNGVAGAQLATISEGLGKTIGVKSGVLVMSAPAGGPAYESGLRDGDVIQKAAGQDARSVNDVRDQVRRANENGDRSVELEVMREKKVRRVMLTW